MGKAKKRKFLKYINQDSASVGVVGRVVTTVLGGGWRYLVAYWFGRSAR